MVIIIYPKNTFTDACSKELSMVSFSKRKVIDFFFKWILIFNFFISENNHYMTPAVVYDYTKDWKFTEHAPWTTAADWCFCWLALRCWSCAYCAMWSWRLTCAMTRCQLRFQKCDSHRRPVRLLLSLAFCCHCNRWNSFFRLLIAYFLQNVLNSINKISY